MGTGDNFLYDIVSGEHLYIHEIDVIGLCSLDVKLCVSIRLNSLFSPFFGGTECHEQG